MQAGQSCARKVIGRWPNAWIEQPRFLVAPARVVRTLSGNSTTEFESEMMAVLGGGLEACNASATRQQRVRGGSCVQKGVSVLMPNIAGVSVRGGPIATHLS